jgi:protein-tyrosine phosphatase
VVDLHCHVLPGVDDGPVTLEESIEFARAAALDGTTTIAATPHVDFGHPEIDSAFVAARVGSLQESLDEAGVEIRIVTGGELDGRRALDTPDPELDALKLGGGRWLLVECPLSRLASPGFPEVARALAYRGHRVLLAHPERSPVFLRNPEVLDELVEEGMLGQVTASALTGKFGKTVRENAVRMVNRGVVHVVASDGHNEGRPASITGELLGSGLDPALIEWMGRDVPRALLAGGSMPPRPGPSAQPKRSRLGRLVSRK